VLGSLESWTCVAEGTTRSGCHQASPVRLPPPSLSMVQREAQDKAKLAKFKERLAEQATVRRARLHDKLRRKYQLEVGPPPPWWHIPPVLVS